MCSLEQLKIKYDNICNQHSNKLLELTQVESELTTKKRQLNTLANLIAETIKKKEMSLNDNRRYNNDLLKIDEEINRLNTKKENNMEQLTIRLSILEKDEIVKDSRVKSIDEKIKELINNQHEIENKIQTTNNKIKEYNEIMSNDYKIKLQKEIEQLQSEYNEKSKSYQYSIKTKKEGERLIKECELKDKYINYAKDYVIEWEDDIDLFSKCNRHRQDELLYNSNGGLGWYVEEECPHRYEGECDGWYVNEKSCECGNYKGWTWNEDDFDQSDILMFNIECNEPYGHAETMW